MKNKKLLSLLLALIIIFSSFTPVLAATFDLYHMVNMGDDVKFNDFARKPSSFLKVADDIDNYLQKHRDGKYYSVKEIDEEMKNGALNASEAIKNLDAYIEIKDNNRILERIGNELNLNKASNPEDFYTLESWENYLNARTELENIKSKRFEKEIILEGKISSLKTAFEALEAAILNKDDLISLLYQAKSRNKDNYTTESFQALEVAVANGDLIVDKENATKGEVESAVEELKNALSNLIEKRKIVYIVNLEDITVSQGANLELPENVTVVYEDETRDEKIVSWTPSIVDTNAIGTVNLVGEVEGTNLQAKLKVTVIQGVNKSVLEGTIIEAKEKLTDNLTPVEKEKLQNEINSAESILENSNSQSEIDMANSQLRSVIDSLKGNPEITNLKPEVDVNIQPEQSLKISFDSQPGGIANFEVGMPVRRARRSLNMDSNMNEVNPGHYEGTWTAPEGFYVEGLTIKVSLRTDEGLLITKEATGKINITNEHTVTYSIENEVIGTEALKTGEKPKNVPIPEKEGYTFSHWELGEVVVNPETVEITGNTNFVAIMNPIGDLSATVEYIDSKGNELKESKIIDNLGFGSEISENAPTIDGYLPNQEAKSIKIGMGTNKITFVYRPRTDIPYTVKYQSNGEEIRTPQVMRGTFKEENSVETPEIPGYTLETQNPTILLNSVSDNEIILNYNPRTDILYNVKHVQIKDDGSEKTLNTYTKTGTFKSEVSENAIDYPGLISDKESKSIKLNSIDNNEIVFEYRERTDLYYTIKYENRQGETWSKNIPAKLNAVINSEDIKKIFIENNGQDYAVENIDKENLQIEDRVENNVFNVNVYKTYPLDKYQDLKNLLIEANKITKPAYSNENAEWTNYWNAFEAAKNNYSNTLLTEDNKDELKNNLEDNIEIIKMISDFDSAWKDRVKPKGFEQTMNDQAQVPDVYGRFKIYYNQYTNTIKVGMSKEQQEKTFAAGAVTVGLKTAMLNVLNSDNLYTVESKGIVAEIRDAEGNKKSDSDLQSEGLKLAQKWLPEGASPFKNKWGELIGTPPVDFIMKGKTSKGTNVTRTYTFEFLDKDNI